MMTRLLVVTPPDEIYQEAADVICGAGLLGVTECEVDRGHSPDLRKLRDTLVVCLGKTSTSERFLPPGEMSQLTDDGYLLRAVRSQEVDSGNLVILAVGNSLRADFYAANDLARIWKENASDETIRTLDRAEKPAFPMRVLLRYLPDFGLLDASRPLDDGLREEMRSDARFVLKNRYNMAQVREMGMMVLVDFEQMGYPEVYGSDPKFKAEWQERIAMEIAKTRELIDIYHRYDLDFCAAITLMGFKLPWINQNFLQAHPEARAELGRDDPSINWGDGWDDRWCPSSPVTWEFIERYLRIFLRQFDIDILDVMAGDVYGVLNCACVSCRELPYEQRIRKLLDTCYRVMKRERPNCVLVHRNLCFVELFRGRERQIQDRMLHNLPDTLVNTHWGNPQNFDVSHDWRQIYQQPLIGHPRLALTLGLEWHLHPADRFAVQTPQVYREQLRYAAVNQVYGVQNNYMRDMDAHFWMQFEPNCLDSLWHEESPEKPLMPWHLDHEAMVQCVWNPFTFDVDGYWERWCARYFGEAGTLVKKAFEDSTELLDILAMWDIGDFAGGGLPPFSYMDRIFSGERLEEIADAFWVDVKTILKQTHYPRHADGYDATRAAGRIVEGLKNALEVRPDDETIKRWLGYAESTNNLALAFRLYHEAYFLRRAADRQAARKKLQEAQRAIEGFKMPDYHISCRECEAVSNFYTEEIKFQIRQLEEGVDEEFSPLRYAKVLPPRRTGVLSQ